PCPRGLDAQGCAAGAGLRAAQARGDVAARGAARGRVGAVHARLLEALSEQRVAITESRERRTRIRHGFATPLGCGLAIGALQLAGVFSAFDLRLLDLRFRLRGERTARDEIAIVGVDDATIRGYGAWPLPRDAYALLITAIEDAG